MAGGSWSKIEFKGFYIDHGITCHVRDKKLCQPCWLVKLRLISRCSGQLSHSAYKNFPLNSNCCTGVRSDVRTGLRPVSLLQTKPEVFWLVSSPCHVMHTPMVSDFMTIFCRSLGLGGIFFYTSSFFCSFLSFLDILFFTLFSSVSFCLSWLFLLSFYALPVKILASLSYPFNPNTSSERGIIFTFSIDFFTIFSYEQGTWPSQ